ncbi:MAG TPA: YncE family protein [Burkholderiales bacterium]|jgi:DNA-binding beta-propeller fold protein YncE
MKRIALASAFTFAVVAAPAAAQLAVSANDNKQINVAGVGSVVPNAAPDTVSVIDMGVFPPRLVGEVQAPASVVGPPTSVAVAPDESFALVSSATKKDPANPAKVVDDNRLSVIDLKALKVVQTLEAGAGAAGVTINASATLALVANRNEGTVSVFTIKGMTLAPAGKVALGGKDSGPSTVKFIGDGKRALVTRDGDSTLTILAVAGQKVSATGRNFFAGIRPYGADVTPDGRYAVVANVGRGQGDADTASLIDLSMNPPRTVDTITVGPTPEGIRISPNGKYAALVVHNGSAYSPSSPFYNAFGKVVLLGINSGRLVKLSEERVGRWSQGAAFSADSSTLLVQNMVEKDIQVFKIELDQLRDTWHRIKLSGGGAALGTAH